MTVGARGQVEFSPSKRIVLPLFYVDTASFRSHVEGQSRLEIYTKISNDQLLFQKEGGRFLSHIETSLGLFDGEEQVAGGRWDDRIVASRYEDTRAGSIEQIRQYVFLVRPGRYRLVARMRDLLAQKVSGVEIEAEVPAYGAERLQLSRLMFAQRIGSPSDSTTTAVLHPSAGEQRSRGEFSSASAVFMKGTRQVIPVVQRVYGEAFPTLMVYVEVYNRGSGVPLTLEYRVYDRWNKIVLRRSETVREDPKEGVEIDSAGTILKTASLDLTALSEGPYQLQIVAREGSSGGQASTSGMFQIRRSYRALFRTKPKDVIESLRYIASKKELKALQSEDEQERMEAWDRFWERRAPFSKALELQEEYYRRVRYANVQFTNVIHRGWRTDRGRIYILYGSPDEVQRYPFEVDRKPYEIWRYYKINQEFVFVDEDGFGEYRLQDQGFGEPGRQIGR